MSDNLDKIVELSVEAGLYDDRPPLSSPFNLANQIVNRWDGETDWRYSLRNAIEKVLEAERARAEKAEEMSEGLGEYAKVLTETNNRLEARVAELEAALREYASPASWLVRGDDHVWDGEVRDNESNAWSLAASALSPAPPPEPEPGVQVWRNGQWKPATREDFRRWGATPALGKEAGDAEM